jgi:hypothetical protein
VLGGFVSTACAADVAMANAIAVLRISERTFMIAIRVVSMEVSRRESLHAVA